MSFAFLNLDDTTRNYMLQELDYDVSNNTLYISPRLNPSGVEQYESLLRNAIENGDEESLALEILNRNLLNTHETRNRNGNITQVRVPVTAHETMAEGEFNRFYIRGLCRRAIDEGSELEIYI